MHTVSPPYITNTNKLFVSQIKIKIKLKQSTGTAFVIDGERLLTNAHVVKSAIDIRVRPHGSTRRFPAKVSNEK